MTDSVTFANVFAGFLGLMLLAAITIAAWAGLAILLTFTARGIVHQIKWIMYYITGNNKPGRFWDV